MTVQLLRQLGLGKRPYFTVKSDKKRQARSWDSIAVYVKPAEIMWLDPLTKCEQSSVLADNDQGGCVINGTAVVTCEHERGALHLQE